MRKGKKQVLCVLIGSLVLRSVTPAGTQSPADNGLELFGSGKEAETAEVGENAEADEAAAAESPAATPSAKPAAAPGGARRKSRQTAA